MILTTALDDVVSEKQSPLIKKKNKSVYHKQKLITKIITPLKQARP